MTAVQIGIIATVVSICVGITSLVMFFTNRKDRNINQGQRNATIDAKLDGVKDTVSDIKKSNEKILEKVDNTSTQLAKVEESVKSAHRRIDELVGINKEVKE